MRQWLNLELLEFQNFKANVPGFDPLLKQAMLAEPVEFINEMLQEDESILDLLHCEFAMINERLARHYGIPVAEIISDVWLFLIQFAEGG